MPGRGAVLAVLVLSLGATAGGCGGSSADKAGGAGSEKRVALTFAVRDSVYAEREFPAAVERLSRGSIDVQVRGRWRFGDLDYERGLADDVRAGKADIGVVGARVWDRLGVTAFRGLLAPLLLDRLDLQEMVLRSPSTSRLVASLGRAGVVGIAVLPGASRRPFGVTHALVAPADYAGARIGTRPGELTDGSLHAVGATTSPWSGGSLVRIDGLELDLVSVANNFYDQPGRVLTANVVLWPQLQTVFMNRKAFEALTPAQRAILRRAGREAANAVLADIESDERAALAAICERRRLTLATASPADLLALRKAFEPVYASLERDPDARRLIDRILRRRGRSGVGAPELRCSGRSSQAGEKTSAFEGRWRYAPTRRELVDVGMSPPEAELLSGPVDFVFAGERFRIIARGRVVATGRYTKRGDVLGIVFETGPPIAPRRHVFELAWSTYRGRLTFSPVAGREPLLYLIAAPLTRTR